jgi:hypothetical protein
VSSDPTVTCASSWAPTSSRSPMACSTSPTASTCSWPARAQRSHVDAGRARRVVAGGASRRVGARGRTPTRCIVGGAEAVDLQAPSMRSMRSVVAGARWARCVRAARRRSSSSTMPSGWTTRGV